MAAGITGCDVFHDDLDQCDLFLEFRYDYNMVNEDWFADQVEEVKVLSLIHISEPTRRS